MIFPPNNTAGTDDAFHALRGIQSPLSIDTIKEYVHANLHTLSMWQKLRMLLFQSIVVIVASSISLMQHNVSDIIHNNVLHTTVALESSNTIPVITTKAPASRSGSDAYLITTPTQTSTATNANAEQHYLKNITKTTTDSQQIEHVVNDLNKEALESNKNMQTDHSSFFAQGEAAVIFGRMQMFGSGVSVGMIDNGLIAKAHLFGATGSREDKSSLSVSTVNMTRLKSASWGEIDLMTGPYIALGKFAAALDVGPSLALSSNIIGIKGSKAFDQTILVTTLGVAGELSTEYNFNSMFSANVTGALRYHSSINTGIFFGISIHP